MDSGHMGWAGLTRLLLPSPTRLHLIPGQSSDQTCSRGERGRAKAREVENERACFLCHSPAATQQYTLHVPAPSQRLSVSQRGGQVQVEGEEPEAHLLPGVSQISACDLTELWSQLCLVPGGGSAQASCFGWKMPGWLLGKMRGEEPSYHRFDHQRSSGKSSVSGGNGRPTAVGSVPGSTPGADLRVGTKSQVLLLAPSRWTSRLSLPLPPPRADAPLP